MEESITKVNRAKKIRFEKSGYYFIGLVAIMFLGFWPTYFSKYFDGTANFNLYFHFHFMMASLWIGLLIVQPLLIKRKKLAVHKQIGKLSFYHLTLVYHFGHTIETSSNWWKSYRRIGG